MNIFLHDTAILVAQHSRHYGPNSGGEAEAAAAAGVVLFVFVFYLIILFVAIAVSLAIQAAICYAFYICLNRLPEQFREREPWQAFLLFIPFFNIVWQFFMFLGTSQSYQRYFEAHGRYEHGDCGHQLGLWTCIIQFIPFASIAAPVLMILYFVKILDLRKQVPEEYVPV